MGNTFDNKAQHRHFLDEASLREDKRLTKLLKTVVNEVKQYAEYQITHTKSLTEIGLALSVEKNMNKLLEMIVSTAMDFAMADAGTLYRKDNDKHTLKFTIMQNQTLNTKLGGTSGTEISLPPVPLEIDGKPNYSNVSSYAALTGKTVNIPDVYVAEDFDFTGPKKYDKATGYRSKSMLVIPMKNHENDCIGVLQLLNARDLDTGAIIPFPANMEGLAGSLASQAAIALTNMQLIEELKELFYSFIKSIATAIDEKSPYTGGHIGRVVELTMLIAEKINEMNEGPFANIHLSEDEMEELRLAAWMHDVGKITTPEYVVDKGKKLETIFDRIQTVETRFDLIGETLENTYLQKKLELSQEGKATPEALRELDAERVESLKKLDEDKRFVVSCNQPGEYMGDDKIERLKEIGKRKYTIKGKVYQYLTKDELYNLSIRKGSLTKEEREIIQNHVAMTKKMLDQLPFPKKLSHTAKYAGEHHEKLDGTGYPLRLTAEQLPLQSRIMAIADVFEALSAKDRPYKPPLKLSQIITIMEKMKKDHHIDPEIYDLFMNSELLKKYAEKELTPEQIDI